jgi:quercetin dioxygenase-like cupin family protein
MRQKAIRFILAFCVMFILKSCAPTGTRPETNQAPAVVRQLVKTSRSWNGELLPAYPEGQPEITILRISIPAGTRLDKHNHPVINGGVLLSGQLTVVTTDGKTLHLKAGDPVVEVVNTLHYGINQGKIPAEIIVFYAGIVEKPITVIEPQ